MVGSGGSRGSRWRVREEHADEVRRYLLTKGAFEQNPKPAEAWRINLSDATMVYWSKGTLYSYESISNDPVVAEAWAYIDSLVGPPVWRQSGPML
jgi:hypothetical protein